MKLTARTHQSLIWDRSRHVLRLRSTLREYFPAALLAFEDVDAPDALELLGRAPDPDQAVRLSLAVITAALKRAHRRNVENRAQQLRTVLRAQELRQAPVLQNAYAAVVASEVAITALNIQIDRLGAVVGEHFGRHRDAEIYASLSGLGVILAARVLGEFRDSPDQYADAKARKNYAGTSPITRAFGTKKVVLARYARNPTTRRRRPAMGVLLATRITRSHRLLPATPSSQDRPPGRPCANSPTASSASCTAASKPTPPTTNTPPGHTSWPPPLDRLRTWDVCRDSLGLPRPECRPAEATRRAA